MRTADVNAEDCVSSQSAHFLKLVNHNNYAVDYHYEKRTTDSQITHILTINPNKYQIELVRAHNGNGRETVAADVNTPLI